MSLLNPPYTQALTFERPSTDVAGNATFTKLGVINGLVSLAAPGTEPGIGARYTQSGTVFVPRGTDIRSGDRFTYQDNTYTVAGVRRGDHDNPFTGDDFGWIVWSFHGGESRWT